MTTTIPRYLSIIAPNWSPVTQVQVFIKCFQHTVAQDVWYVFDTEQAKLGPTVRFVEKSIKQIQEEAIASNKPVIDADALRECFQSPVIITEEDCTLSVVMQDLKDYIKELYPEIDTSYPFTLDYGFLNWLSVLEHMYVNNIKEDAILAGEIHNNIQHILKGIIASALTHKKICDSIKDKHNNTDKASD